MRRRILLAVAAVLLLAPVFALTAIPASAGYHLVKHQALPRRQGQPPAAPTLVCGQPILNSPWFYTGAATTFTSGQFPGLPTFGSAGTDFPSATAGMIVPAGDNTTLASSGALDVTNTVIFFEAGDHVIRNATYTGNHSDYVGGYTAGAGEATLDGVGGQGAPNLSTPSSGSVVNNTWEYLTIKNFTSILGSAVMGNINGGQWEDGDTYLYDTIGPNLYAPDGHGGSVLNTTANPGQGGGYAINMGYGTTATYDCLTQNAEGAFNGTGNDINISHDEISWNALGEYPDSGGPGASPFACGCSGAGKLGFSLNPTFTYDYIHDNYNVGIWLDFDNTGANISNNYIASNWSSGVMIEASYNSSVTDNTLVGNGWASDGAWPAGHLGLNCGGVSCTNGAGPVSASFGVPFPAIYLSGSGGNSNLNTIAIPAAHGGGSENSNYSGQLLVENNLLSYNYGGVEAYTDTNRFPGNLNADSACGPSLGTFNQNNSATYYEQTKLLYTPAADVTISGSSVTSTVGTYTICGNYGAPISGSGTQTLQQPEPGQGVYNLNTGAFLGNVNTVTSANAFTLDNSPGNVTGAQLAISSYGGCGLADYYGGAPGVQTGNPAALYWDNCNWGSRNITVSGNTFTTQQNTITGCAVPANQCNFQLAIAFLPGTTILMRYWQSYALSGYVAKASGGIGNVWSGNTYIQIGPGGWQFQAGNQGNTVTTATWQGGTYGQDAGSTYTGVPVPSCFTAKLSHPPPLTPWSGCPPGSHPGKPAPKAAAPAVRLALPSGGNCFPRVPYIPGFRSPDPGCVPDVRMTPAPQQRRAVPGHR